MLTVDDHKIGITVNPASRSSALNTGSAQGSTMIYTRKTFNAKIVESGMKIHLRRYNIGNGGGTEHYNNRVEHSVDMMDLNCVFQDTLASMYEDMKRDDKIDMLVAKLLNEKEPKSTSTLIRIDEAPTQSANAGPTADDEVDPCMLSACDEFFDEYVDFNPIRTQEFAGKKYFAYIKEKDMFAKLWDWCAPKKDKNNKSSENAKFAKSAWKTAMQSAMENRNRPRAQIKPRNDGVQTEFWAYNRVAWKPKMGSDA